MIEIKGMSMPNSCHWDCPLCNEDGGACMLGSYDSKTDTTKERASDCPLVEQEPNGTQINKILEDIEAEICNLDRLNYSSGERVYLDEVLEIIDKHLGYCRTGDERKNLSYTEVENSENIY